MQLTTFSGLTETMLARHPGYLVMENSRVWGSPSASITFGEDGKNIDAWFAPELMVKAQAFFGVSTVRSWNTTRDWIKRLRVAPFKGDGLTSMQLCNQLVLMGLCQPPTPQEMSDWIANHPNLGACRGLELVGFRSLQYHEEVELAFQLFYYAYEDALTPEQKERMRFSPITVENLLCKISRADALLRKLKLKSPLSLLGLATAYWKNTGRLLQLGEFDMKHVLKVYEQKTKQRV